MSSIHEGRAERDEQIRRAVTIVIDASALVELLTHTSLAHKIDRHIGAAELVAPDVLNPEVLQGLRGLERGGRLTSTRASLAVASWPKARSSASPRSSFCMKRGRSRANLSAYDACYVALAQRA